MISSSQIPTFPFCDERMSTKQSVIAHRERNKVRKLISKKQVPISMNVG